MYVGFLYVKVVGVLPSGDLCDIHAVFEDAYVGIYHASHVAPLVEWFSLVDVLECVVSVGDVSVVA